MTITNMNEDERIALIRTGCLSCRARGVPCDAGNTRCQKNLSTCWNSNKPMALRRYDRKLNSTQQNASPDAPIAYGWQGTYQERQSLHFFSVVSAPELAGYADIHFWQEGLLQSTLCDDAIRHIVAAIGASHEYSLRKQASRSSAETDRLGAFALRQCNKSIQHLVRPMKADMERELLRNLTAAVLFACFQSANEDRKTALPHVVHARRLVEQSKTALDKSRTLAFPVHLSTIEPLVAHYEAQTGLYYGDHSLEAVNAFDVYEHVEIDSIAEARISLEQALSSFQSIACRLAEELSDEEFLHVTGLKTAFADWFHRWDYAFSTFMARSVNSRDPVYTGTANLLRLHQTAGLIVSAADYAKGEAAWQDFDAQYEVIVDLATKIFSVSQKRAVAYQPPENAYFSSTMGLTEPLYLVASRCPDGAIAERARHLMRKLPPSEGAYSGWRISLLEDFLCTIIRNSSHHRCAR